MSLDLSNYNKKIVKGHKMRKLRTKLGQINDSQLFPDKLNKQKVFLLDLMLFISFLNLKISFDNSNLD